VEHVNSRRGSACRRFAFITLLRGLDSRQQFVWFGKAGPKRTGGVRENILSGVKGLTRISTADPGLGEYHGSLFWEIQDARPGPNKQCSRFGLLCTWQNPACPVEGLEVQRDAPQSCYLHHPVLNVHAKFFLSDGGTWSTLRLSHDVIENTELLRLIVWPESIVSWSDLPHRHRRFC
jgi:hypothetical protein